jgi:hydroxymethylpyrimidine pyrophosphatase-like HAD family hydrolase
VNSRAGRAARLPGLLASDLDGTLLNDAGRPHPGVVEALAALDAAGVPLALCSGRPQSSVERRGKPLGATPRVLISCHGALVVDAASGAGGGGGAATAGAPPPAPAASPPSHSITA